MGPGSPPLDPVLVGRYLCKTETTHAFAKSSEEEVSLALFSLSLTST